ncbi:hypothetical protein, partial [Burkholderia ambifaria]|uniref:hypothetical protein n=1 Tax=Burkholderia ambifaria TaxID=152480 RepID=UPI001ABBC80D
KSTLNLMPKRRRTWRVHRSSTGYLIHPFCNSTHATPPRLKVLRRPVECAQFTAQPVTLRYSRKFVSYKLASALPNDLHPSLAQLFALAFRTRSRIFIQDGRSKALKLVALRTLEMVVSVSSGPFGRHQGETGCLCNIHNVLECFFNRTHHIHHYHIVSSSTPTIQVNRRNSLGSRPD